ncbi:MAG: selenide, water dikinase SelD [Acidobacteria bacterium]|nr:selenide, water dikinase SelD [Acidobacteriota bacterium]
MRRAHGTPATQHPDLLVGIAGADDAGVMRITDNVALVQTVDFFTPIVDDAELWGRIAAANALSDVYAMGGTPLTALQLLSWPRDTLPWDLAADVIDGGLAVLAEAGCTLVGGHSIDDPEPKYGFAITGTVDPEHMITNGGAAAGDVLVLTKPLGTGVITTALKAGAAPAGVMDAAAGLMTRLNDSAAVAAVATGVVAGTDVTGYGLLGHLQEMANASGVTAVVDPERVPIIDGTADLFEAGHFPGGSKRNRRSLQGSVDVGTTDDTTLNLLYDAQTNGGLLLAVSPDDVDALVDRLEASGDGAYRIGEMIQRAEPNAIVLGSVLLP